MQRNIYIAYALWFFLGGFGAHRIYCGKFLSGLLQLLLFWIGSLTAIFLVGYIFLAIWGIWWLADLFFTSNWVEKLNSVNCIEKSISDSHKLKNVEKLYELYKNGAMSYDEYLRRKDEILG
ncbi:NINE protein [Campylobacter fetus]|uniref:NINE protein n=4 Tax=Campylobacter fetus TaxID=196 RepID=A0A5L4IDQ8_CAMFE|nr:NINE protein [Campylobacter fetus]OCS21645.1 hypothetical protein CFVI97532_08595 [Campylobacter fetus subsp. venerealis cfvi97/532]OCS26604.1 hypothetical protein CFVB10_03320 [Campylobacter fetus subsp. venerealis cfvB10]OCS29256.1 hypothetical protein CFVCCUG33900_07140 [Campylobacter fetus subsp. venerealis LMG 6570 = CCUG 33900]OCS41460.1 hypothetical protein CFVI02298_06850 [Campylobacter fetus subsp. venerealis cfvi02/298]ABK83344.1 TM2 [Campylobacter fetus subsp. fetus 82-40]